MPDPRPDHRRARTPSRQGQSLQSRVIEQHVLRTEVAVHQHAAIGDVVRRTEVELVKRTAGTAHSEQHFIGPLLQDLLTGPARHEAEHDMGIVGLDEWRNRKAAGEERQCRDLAGAPLKASGPRYRLTTFPPSTVVAPATLVAFV